MLARYEFLVPTSWLPGFQQTAENKCIRCGIGQSTGELPTPVGADVLRRELAMNRRAPLTAGAEEWAWPRSTGRLRRGYPKSTTAHARKLSVPEARLGREQNSRAAGNAGRQHAGGRGARPVRSHLRKLRCTWILGRPASSPDATCRRQPCRG